MRTLSATMLVVGLALAPVANAAPEPPAPVQPGSPANTETVPEAEHVVSSLQDALIDAMRHADAETYEQRAARLEPVIAKTHHLAYLGQSILRDHWKDLDKDDKLRFLRVFSRLSLANYASRFDSYSGERFRIVSSRLMRDNLAFVRTELIKADSDTVSLDYALRKFDEGWRIINIVADGVSEVATKRTEYDAIISKYGLDKLIDDIEDQIARLQAPDDDQDQPSQSD